MIYQFLIEIRDHKSYRQILETEFRDAYRIFHRVSAPLGSRITLKQGRFGKANNGVSFVGKCNVINERLA